MEEIAGKWEQLLSLEPSFLTSLPFLSCRDGDGLVRMGTEGAYPPLTISLTIRREVAGIERELGDELCRRTDLRCTWVTKDRSSLIQNLVEGR